MEIKASAFLTTDDIGTIEFALEELIKSGCCEDHQKSANEIYQYLQVVDSRIQDMIEQDVRKYGEA